MYKQKSIDAQILDLIVSGMVWTASVVTVIALVVTVYEAILLRRIR